MIVPGITSITTKWLSQLLQKLEANKLWSWSETEKSGKFKTKLWSKFTGRTYVPCVRLRAPLLVVKEMGSSKTRSSSYGGLLLIHFGQCVWTIQDGLHGYAEWLNLNETQKIAVRSPQFYSSNIKWALITYSHNHTDSIIPQWSAVCSPCRTNSTFVYTSAAHCSLCYI